MVNIPDRSQGAGVPGQWSEEITAFDVALVTGHEPAVLTEDRLVAGGQDMAALTVVGVNGFGALVPAVKGTTEAVGILLVAVKTAAGETGVGAPIYEAGCFNPDRLVWDASYATDADKFAAFRGAPTPTNIVIRRPKTATV